jgi:hypothetical protein
MHLQVLVDASQHGTEIEAEKLRCLLAYIDRTSHWMPLALPKYLFVFLSHFTQVWLDQISSSTD